MTKRGFNNIQEFTGAFKRVKIIGNKAVKLILSETISNAQKREAIDEMNYTLHLHELFPDIVIETIPATDAEANEYNTRPNRVVYFQPIASKVTVNARNLSEVFHRMYASIFILSENGYCFLDGKPANFGWLDKNLLLVDADHKTLYKVPPHLKQYFFECSCLIAGYNCGYINEKNVHNPVFMSSIFKSHTLEQLFEIRLNKSEKTQINELNKDFMLPDTFKEPHRIIQHYCGFLRIPSCLNVNYNFERTSSEHAKRHHPNTRRNVKPVSIKVSNHTNTRRNVKPVSIKVSNHTNTVANHTVANHTNTRRKCTQKNRGCTIA